MSGTQILTSTQTPIPPSNAISTQASSPNDTAVIGTTSAITDAGGNVWTITNDGQVAVNGIGDPTTANVTELAYVNGTIWQENASKLWWGKSQPSAGWAPSTGTATSPLQAPAPVPTPTLPATPVPSPNDKVVTSTTSSITDASGNAWTITKDGQVAVNGIADPTTANVTELAYVNGTIWQENASKLWWGETQPNRGWDISPGTATSPLPTTPVATPAPIPPPISTPIPAPISTPAPGSPATATPSPNVTVVTGTSSSITDASGNSWKITNRGQVAINGIVDVTTANVTELAYVNGTIWQENANRLWWGETQPNASWAPAAGTATSPLPTSSRPATTPPAPSPSTIPGTRDPSQTPFASTSVFNLPLGLNAQWQSNAQLSNSTAFINTAVGSGYNENIYTSASSDPLVAIVSNGSAIGSPGTYQVHVPLGAVPAPGSDATLSVDDTSTGTWYSFGGFKWTGPNTATATQGSGESDSGSGITVNNSNADEGVGTLRQSDLQAGTIDHMLRVEIPTTMAMSYSQTSVNTLAPYAWPQTAEDGFALNGNGGPMYSGTVPFGVTIGIAASAIEPAAVAANAGANMLWKALQHHGAMIRDTGSSGNTVTFQADQQVDQNDPLILGMEKYSSQIMASVQILTNQGPSNINGGGTPIVPLDPAPRNAAGTTAATTLPPAPTVAASTNDSMVLGGATNAITDASGNIWTITGSGQCALNGVADATTANVTELAYVNKEVWQKNTSELWWAKTNPTASWVGGTGTSPLPAAITVAAGSAKIGQSQISIVATAGGHMLFISGSGDVVNLSGGTNTVTDTGTGNTYILPTAGNGTDAFTSDILATGDTLDLKTALAATNWNGAASTLSDYLTVTDSSQSATLLIAPTSGGVGVAIATISGSGTNLAGLLAHAFT